MRRFGCKYFLYTLLLIVLLSTSGVYAHPSEADTVNINSLSSQANAAQYYSDTVYTESGVQINDTIVIKANKNLLNGIKKKKKRKILLSLELIQGDGNLAIDISKKNKLIGYYNFIPDTSGIYTVEFLSVQTVSHPKHGIDPNIPPESTIYIYSYSVVTNSISSNQSPVIEDQYGFASLCNLNEPKSFQVTAFDAENDPLTYVKLSGSGSINSGTGLLTYTPDTSGVFTFEIAVYDAAGGDTAFVYDTILLNSPPVMSSNDSTVNLCQVEEICFDVFGFDFDGDTMQIFMLEGLGNFTSVNDSGRVCFMPADVDSATYQFVFRAADSCLLNFGLAPPSASESFQDTALITVIINQSPQIFCPGEQNFFDCVGGDFCFDISALDPDNDLLNYNIISNNATIVNQTVCITTIESVQLDVEIEVFDECGAADTCLVPVTIVVNQAPAVITAPDFDIFMCQSDTVCFSASVSDPDFNISSLLLNHGEYDQLVDSICFVPDTAGLYSFEFIAVDACNLADTSITNVNVVLNRTPEIFLGNDLTLDVCTNEEICITPSIVDYDDNIALVIPNFGLYNDLTGEVCFTPDSSGVYSLIVEAIDVCGVFDIDSLNININIKDAPFVSLGSNQSYFQCQPEEICIDINTIANYFDLQSNIGIINQLDNQVCFTPDTAGTYTLEVTVTDSCGFIASDTINIDVAFNNAPNISGFFDQEVYLCSPETICLPVTIDDVDGNLVTIDVNLGSYQNGQVCFVPYDSGNYEIIVTATDECGLQAVDTAVVHVLTDQAVNITVPGDTTFFVCELDTFCFPVYGIPENGVVTVTGINTWYNPVNSTICYYAECSSVNNITLTVNTPCNTIVKEFSVTVICNTNPLVILPPDTSYNLCTPAEICIPVGINDVDNNLESINVIGGSYDFISGNICINADTSGIYTIGVTAVDSCQASDYDEILVTVEVNSTPVCTVPNDTTIGLCTPSQISLPATVIDIDNNLTEFVIIEGPGSLVNGNWVYNAVIDESFMVVVRATDDCGFICEDTFNVVIEINGAPTCNITDNQTFFQCLPAEVAIPVNPVDPDNDPVQCYIISGPGEIINSFWVYTPTASETVEVTIRCTDTCGLFCESTFSASFIINEAPVCDVPNDTNIFLCNIQEVSLPYSYTDNDGTPVTCEIISGSGQLLNGNWVYTPNADETVSVTIRCTDSCGAYCESSFNVTFDINDAPLLDVPVDTSFMLCEPGAVTIPISATDVDNNIRDYTLVSGPGVMINSDWVYTPSGDEVFDIIVRSTDSCDAFDEKTVSVTIHINQLPVIADQTFSEVFCTSGELRVIDIIAADSENDVLSFELLSGSGSIDPVTGSISYNPDTAGTYIFEVAVSDSCGFSTAFITDVIGLNNAPQFSGYDSTIYLCDVGEISFPVSAFDPDGDSLFISQFDGPGQFTQLTENSGVTNFLPSDVDSATYLFAYCITDSCGAYPQKFIQPECENFISITVIINRAPQFIVCPGEQQFSTCDVGTFCFDISAIDPDDDSLIFTILAGNATITDTTVCVTGNAYEQFDVVIEVSDTCNHTDTCVVPVIIDGFASPDVISADDFPVNLCVIEPVCFDVIIGGPVTNIDSIWTNYGSYDENTQQVCFEPDTAGVYEIIISVVDSCGVLASDTTNVTVNLNDIPVVELGIDFDTTLCGIADICFDVNVSDNMLDYVSLNYGSYDEITGKLCFLADTSGTYRLILTATDICNISTADTVLATVTLSEPPFVDLGTDFDSLLCNISEVCIDVITIDNYASIITGPGSYYNEQTGQLCFTPDLSGNYTLSIEVIDSCGYSAIDEINISIQLNSSPVILPMPDTAVYLCYPELICLPTAITDLDNNIDSITVNRGSYQDSVVCFVPYDSGFYEIIVSAFDGCGEVTADTALVHVITDQAVSIICPNDTTIFVCDFDTLCFPIGGIPSNSVVTVTGINTWFDEQTQSVCFFAECATVNNITVNAATPCGTFSCQFTVTIECNTAPLVIFPPDTSIAICQVSEVCIPVGINDPDNNLDSVVVVGGTYDPISSQVCFATDSTGTYVIQLWAYDACLAEDFDEIIVDISLNSAPYINYTAIDSSFLSCANDSICVPIDIGDIDGNLTDVTTSIGSYHAQSGQICFYPDTSGSYSIIVTATDLCNIQTIDTADVSVALNTPPIVTVNDSSLVFCEIDTVCITFEAIDSDNNIVDIVSSLGTVVGSQICFLPPDFGVYEIIITAIDECGETDIDTASVTVSSISGAQFVTCPENVDTTLCGADTICIENVLITPAEAQVSIYDNGQLTDAAYDFNVGSICIYVNQPGTHNIRVIAEAPCGSDTCDFILQVAFNTEPVVSCPSQIDTVLCLVQTDSICFPVQITGIDVQVTVSPVGQYSNGFVCVPIVNAGTLNIEITATNICGSDTCNTTINVQDKQPPQLFLPDTLVYNRCPGDTNTICIDGIFATDADSIFSLNKVCGPGTYQPITNDSGEVCFLPDQFGYYEFCFETFNGCQTVVDTFYVEIAQATDCEVCVRVTIDGGSCASVGSVKSIDINVETNTSIGGFELFISYDASVMSFNGTDTVGTAVADWEYFTYRLESEDCGLACPSGIVKLFGLADITNGPNHPPDSSLNPNGTLAKIIFNISSDQNLGGQFLPINFGWYSCGDNTFSDPSGNQLYMDSRIFNAENILIWDEADDINFPDSIRPYGLGNEDSCLTNAVLIPPTRCVEFTYGGICIIPPSNQADRGDINLNGVAYEIGDAVLFSNYFIYGLSVFTIDLARQIASTDVNADGLTLSVADLVLLIRIIIGDADPFPKLIPYDDELALTTQYNKDIITVSSEAVSDIGAALLVYDIDEKLNVGEPHLVTGVNNMSLGYAFVEGQLRILIYNFGKNKISSGHNDLIEIPYTGEGTLTLSSTEFVDYFGQPYNVVSKENHLPKGFSLSQNYPNPFNPSTTIDFAMPVASEWTLTIYNINGHLVKQFEGYDEAGTMSILWDGTNTSHSRVASGLYLYRLDAESFSKTKKMILIK